MVGRRYHCCMEGLFDFIVTTALWKDIRFTSERYLRHIVGGQKKNNAYRYSISRYSIHQLVDRQTGVLKTWKTTVQAFIPTAHSNRYRSTTLHTSLVKQKVSIDTFTYLLVTEIGIDRQFDISIARTIAYCADLSEPIGRRNRYR